MEHELDLDDAVANVSGDRARRELEELRAENARLDRIANHQIYAIDALDRECHRLKAERNNLYQNLCALLQTAKNCGAPDYLTANAQKAIDNVEVGSE